MWKKKERFEAVLNHELADCAALGKPSTVIVDELLHREKLWLNDGEMYGETERPFVRVNIACPRSVMLEGLKRFEKYVKGI